MLDRNTQLLRQLDDVARKRGNVARDGGGSAGNGADSSAQGNQLFQPPTDAALVGLRLSDIVLQRFEGIEGFVFLVDGKGLGLIAEGGEETGISAALGL